MSHRLGSPLQDRPTAIDRRHQRSIDTLDHDVRRPHVTSHRRDARLPFRFGNGDDGAEAPLYLPKVTDRLLARAANAYARTRKASPAPISAESPSNTTTPGKPMSANTIHGRWSVVGAPRDRQALQHARSHPARRNMSSAAPACRYAPRRRVCFPPDCDRQCRHCGRSELSQEWSLPA